MSERTTIGGTVYESIGSSNSNLLLRCNGTARVQWGNRLIDLIKNGKIASGDSSTHIYAISDESEIKSDGVYVLSKDGSLQLIIYIDGKQYNLTNADLYISANTKQDLTVEQRKQAIKNIGIYYPTLNDLYTSGIQEGIAYVLENKNLYTISNGVISEFEAKLKTVTEEKENNDGDANNTSVKLILSVSDSKYIVLSEDKIMMHKPIYINKSVEFGSEGASQEQGYRLYIDHLGSHLDVDYINVRSGLEATFSKGMIIMHCGNIPIPDGWAVCDGNEITYDGVSYTPPNLKDKFIKAAEETVADSEVVEDPNYTDPKAYEVIYIVKL